MIVACRHEAIVFLELTWTRLWESVVEFCCSLFVRGLARSSSASRLRAFHVVIVYSSST